MLVKFTVGRTAAASVSIRAMAPNYISNYILHHHKLNFKKTTKQVLPVLDEAQKIVLLYFLTPCCFPPLFCVMKWVIVKPLVLYPEMWLLNGESTCSVCESWTSLFLHDTFLLQEQLNSHCLYRIGYFIGIKTNKHATSWKQCQHVANDKIWAFKQKLDFGRHI